jgi:hypothetical protein
VGNFYSDSGTGSMYQYDSKVPSLSEFEAFRTI